jgi:hypothetical protein
MTVVVPKPPSEETQTFDDLSLTALVVAYVFRSGNISCRSEDKFSTMDYLVEMTVSL